jgi:hypothetical protein
MRGSDRPEDLARFEVVLVEHDPLGQRLEIALTDRSAGQSAGGLPLGPLGTETDLSVNDASSEHPRSAACAVTSDAEARAPDAR